MASYALGEMVYKITGDSSGFNTTLKQSESGVKGLADTIKNVLITGALVALSKSFIKSASDAAETAQKFGVVFSGITDAANDATAALVDGFGLSTQEAKELLSTSGNILQSMGFQKQASLDLSTAINKLAADYVSFTNYAGGVAGASDAILKGLNGEREALKGLGIAINETDMQKFAETQGLVWENLDKSAKAMLTFEAITARSGNVIGDFARSSDSFANQSRILKGRLDDLKVSIGENLLPVATTAISTFSGMVAAFNELDPSTKSLIFELGTLATVLGAAAKVAPALVSGVSNMSGFLKNLPALVNPASAAVVGIGLVLYGFAKALEVSGEKFATLENKLGAGDFAKKTTKDLYESLKSTDAGLADVQKRIDLVRRTADAAGPLTPKKQIKEWQKDIEGLQENYQNILNNRQLIAAEIDKRENAPKGGKKGSDIDSLAKDLKNMQTNFTGAGETATKQQDIWAGKAASLSNIFNQAQDAAIDFWDAATPKDKLAAVVQTVNDISNAVGGLGSAFEQFFAAKNKAEIDALDAQMQAELEAAGVAEDTAVEKAQKELDAANAAGDATVIKQKEDALKRAKIEEEYAKKKRKLEYEGQLMSWKFQMASAIATAPLMIMNAFNAGIQAGPFAGPILAGVLAGIAATTAGVQIAAIAAAKPAAPKFASGGIVPGSLTSGDQVTAQLNSKEMVLTQEQQATLFNMANGGNGGQPIHLTVQIGAEKLYDMLFNASKRGELLISQGAVVSR